MSLIEQAPDSTLCTHFRRRNRFQPFVRGSGIFGGDPLQPAAVHHAAYTGYGPLVSGPEVLDHFTIRMAPEADAFPADAARETQVVLAGHVSGC
ncbi:MAG: hypothetical protein EOP82_06700 [Variovorax sp.]|nr:MAG: hypothetical protein EOP82_06700 [Variovorax sp.]